MLIKWVKCGVFDRERFDAGQRSWTALSALPGFIGQGGGWSRREPLQAHVFSMWTDRERYESFMDGIHDRVAAGQAASYGAIDVRLFEHRLDIGAGIRGDLDGAAVLRLAYCRVRDDRQEHFVTAQTEVWSPAMTDSPGMLGGVFAAGETAEFLVMTMWATIADHTRYQTERVEELRLRSGVAGDAEQVSGFLIDVEPAWRVRGGA